MRAIDTNVVIRLITRDHEDQALAAEALVKDGAWLSLVALVETCWVLSAGYEFTPPQLARALGILLDHEHIVVEHPVAVERALEVFRKRPKLSFPDCLLIEIARQSGFLPFATFDKDLAKLDDVELIEIKL
jgi:predicted nucleic-acid-binding protein